MEREREREIEREKEGGEINESKSPGSNHRDTGLRLSTEYVCVTLAARCDEPPSGRV